MFGKKCGNGLGDKENAKIHNKIRIDIYGNNVTNKI